VGSGFDNKSAACPPAKDEVCTCSPVLQVAVGDLQLFTECDDVYQAI